MVDDGNLVSLINRHGELTEEIIRLRREHDLAEQRYQGVKNCANPELGELRRHRDYAQAAISRIRSHKKSNSEALRLRKMIRDKARSIKRIEKKVARYEARWLKSAEAYESARLEMRQLQADLGMQLMVYTGAADKHPDITSAHGTVSLRSGNIHLYFGGKDQPTGEGHGHYVLDPELTLQYPREPGQPRGWQNQLVPMHQVEEPPAEVQAVNLGRLRQVASATCPDLVPAG